MVCCGVSKEEYERIGEKENEIWLCPGCLAGELPFLDDSLRSVNELELNGSDGNELELDEAEDINGLRQLMNENKVVFCHLNIRSVVPKFDELQVIMERCSRGLVLGVSETWLDDEVTDAELQMVGFRMYRRDRGRRGGGVMVYVPENICTRRRHDLESTDVEALWIEARILGRC